ncbi:NAD(P)H-hydrate epimerase [Pseudonocardia sp. N23]|uniref:NAD(P)H-hydrate epimerase n=1 Tax=Pseudonocardia sp. N23 TaxID=1987376 RepID=UPI000BFCB3C3|nr:NAD(P)H-hydrate epimerase [Pseudonocardia sp. N23]GAY10152.1 NAD(P)HX epimerase [Pseudonocardia sp. N23]
MRGVFTAQQVRDTERVLIDRLPEGTLMRRAAFGLAVHLRRNLDDRVGRVSGARVVLLVGAGDNGGDALWAGAELRRRGVAVTAVLLVPDRAHPAGLAALRAAGGRVVTVDGAIASIVRADLVVDGIVGISGRGALRDPAPALVDAAAEAGVPVVAVDLPSGVDTDTGAVVGPAVTAVETVTFGALKPVHVLAAARCGSVSLVDIGLGPLLPEPHARVLDDADVAAGWPLPGPADDKYTQGVTGIAAGSSTYPGAAVLATGAAVLATSGMVRYAGSAADEVRARWPEVVATAVLGDAGRVQAWTVGPGLGTDDAGHDALAAVIAQDVPLCVDADAITLLGLHADLREAVRGRPLIVTPHDREFARVAGEVGDDRIAAARRAAAELGVTVLLKGNATVVADPAGTVFVHPSAESWAATAGSGDVLSGVVGALLAAGRDPVWAGAAATHVHGLAASLAAQGVPAPASAIQTHVPAALRTLVAANETT